jgi:hypothetical protein
MKNNEPTYLVSEDDILKISTLIGCVENALKEVLRSRRINVSQCVDQFSEINLYKETSRILCECETESDLPSLNLETLF